jgi:hypothetical protein
MESTVIAVVFVVWLVAAWAMLMMVVAALKDREQRSFGWFLGGSFLLANYNRKHFRIFAASVAVGIAVAVVFNVLLLTGHTKL